MAMIRKQVYLAPQQQKILRRLARKTGKTEAEIIRNALDEHAKNVQREAVREEAWRGIEETIAERAKLPALTKGRTWTRESIYEDL
jgi:hypothetical protein